MQCSKHAHDVKKRVQTVLLLRLQSLVHLSSDGKRPTVPRCIRLHPSSQEYICTYFSLLINAGPSSSHPPPPLQYVAVVDTQMFLLSRAQYNVLDVVPDTDRSYQYRVG